MNYLSVCSGIEAATQVWHPLGWNPVAFSEIDKFPSAVLAHHYPDVPNWGDMTKFKEWPDEQIDLLVGGTPCQSFSVAGLRKGLEDPRGNLALTYCAIAEKYAPRWVVWENVPGVLSADKGRAFGSILGALAELGYGFAYRVLDAQYVRTRRFRRAVPQRRRRVFVVGHLGDWRRAAEVLFDSESLLGNPPPRREGGQKVAPTVTSGAPFSRTGNGRAEAGAYLPVAQMHKSSNTTINEGQTSLPDALYYTHEYCQDRIYSTEGPSPALNTAQRHTVAFNWQSGGDCRGLEPQDTAMALSTSQTPAVQQEMAVRRLTPVECERLQGFPDNFTRIPWRGKKPESCPDGPRYKALGNSMAVNVMEWVGRRIEMIERITNND